MMSANPRNKKPSDTTQDEEIGSFYMGRMRPPEPPQRVLPKGLASSVALAAFAAILWYAYPQGQEKHEGVDVPVITADKSAYKFKPEDPGGMEVRHQDSTVFNPLEGKKETAEKILPAPEEPIAREDFLKPSAKLNLAPQMEKPVTKVEKTAEKVEQVLPSLPAPAPEKIEAKKVEAKPAAVKSTAVKPSASVKSGYYLQLGSYREASGAAKDWPILQSKYPQQLKSLTMSTETVDLGGKGVWTRLYAGPLAEQKARDICSAVKKAAGGCIVAKR